VSEWRPLILILEDTEYMAQLASMSLKKLGCDTLIAYTAAEARELIQKHTPDLFVLDVELPDGNGFDFCKELRKETGAPVLFLTGMTETENKITGLSTGGDYYLTKPYERDELQAVVQSMLRRENQTRKKIAETAIIERKSLVLSIHEGKAFVNGRDAELSQKEYAVLLMLVKNEEKELPYGVLYESIWGVPMHNDTAALRQQISRLKKKLDEENTDDFSIINTSGKGYMFTSQ
jgi:DNA-binding response OmpR family regulator